jgi:hypothetical protein
MNDAQTLRLEIFKARIPLYQISAVARVHPGRLGQMLLGHVPMPAEVASRVEAALERELATAGQRE